MIALDTIREIEAAGYQAWPAAEHVRYDGWDLRYAYGFSRRGNSVYPAEPSTIDRGLKLAWCKNWFEQHGLELVVRQNPATEPGLDEELQARGFTREGTTDVMVSHLDTAVQTLPVFESAPRNWWTAAADLWGITGDRQAGWRGIIELIGPPVGFALVEEADGPVAAGLAAVAGEWVGLFEIIVDPSWRRQGIGRTLTRSLMAWAANHGGQRAFLQVVADNGPAIGLYESVGFEIAYQYWYRRAPRPKN